MNLPATLANSAWLTSSLPAWRRFRRALENPEAAQNAILQRLLRENEGCAYGRECGFGEIHGYEQLRERVPIVGYDELERWIERIRRGEPSVLTQAGVTRLVPTSGSSGPRKLIPFTSVLQREFNAVIGPWMVDLARQYRGLAPVSTCISPNIYQPGFWRGN